MESYLQPEDIKQEFCLVEIKEEVSFELTEDSCIDGIEEEGGAINDTEEEKDKGTQEEWIISDIKEEPCFDVIQFQNFTPTSDILKEENVLANQIKKEDCNNIDLNNDNDFINEEEEIDYILPEGAAKETDPLELPEIKYVEVIMSGQSQEESSDSETEFVNYKRKEESEEYKTKQNSKILGKETQKLSSNELARLRNQRYRAKKKLEKGSLNDLRSKELSNLRSRRYRERKKLQKVDLPFTESPIVDKNSLKKKLHSNELAKLRNQRYRYKKKLEKLKI